MTRKQSDAEGLRVEEFLNPRSMVTPGVAGGLTMIIANSITYHFHIKLAFVGLFVSCLFSLIAIYSAKMDIFQRLVFFVLNSLVIFAMALGSNAAGINILSEKQKPPAGVFKEGSLIMPYFISEADAKENRFGKGVELIRGSGQDVFTYNSDIDERRLIPNNETLIALKFDSVTFVFQLTDAYLKNIPRGPDYPALQTSIVKGSGRGVYLLEQGKRREIPDAETFDKLGLNWKDLRVIPDNALKLIPEGDKIKSRRSFFRSWF